jgi:hypothetical protein
MYQPDLLLESMLVTATDAGLLVGDNVAPAEGGWVNGQPQSGIFKPYSVLMLMQSGSTDGFCGPSEWVTQFSVRHFGASRKQLSWVSNQIHQVLDGQTRWKGSGWQEIHRHWTAFGSVVRVDSVDPPYWQAYDALEVRVAAA